MNSRRAYRAAEFDSYATCATCMHTYAAHCGHTTRVGEPEPHHCSQLCGCKGFVPMLGSKSVLAC